jgi:hypothetical protein
VKTIFRTQIQDLWDEWDPLFVREIATHASTICVRVAGLLIGDRADGPYTSDEPLTIAWERAIKHLVYHGRGRRQHNIAFAIVTARHYPARDHPSERGEVIPHGRRGYQQWARTLPFAERLCWLLRVLRAETAKSVLLHVEDYSARWALESGFRPDLWLMDNPFVGSDEARDRWTAALTRPGLVRHSKLPRIRDWPDWRMHLRRDELFARHLPPIGTHGVWPRRANLGPFVPLTRVMRGAGNMPHDRS